jgi:restriction endonuclease S subunit
LASIRPGEQLSCLYLFYVLRIAEERIRRCSSGSTFEAIGHKQIEDFAIPLPPLSVQQEIVAELDGYQKVADGARQVVENYKTAIAIDPRWKARPLSELIKLSSGKFLPQRDFREGPYLVYGGNGSSGRHDRYFLEESTLIIGRVGEYCGAVHLTQPKSWVTDNALCVTEHSADIVLEYLCPLLNQLNLNQYAKVGGQPSISQGTVFGLSIPVPSLEIQKKIVARIEEEQQLVQANRRLIELFEAKIRDRIKEVWGDQDAGKQQL